MTNHETETETETNTERSLLADLRGGASDTPLWMLAAAALVFFGYVALKPMISGFGEGGNNMGNGAKALPAAHNATNF
jgi:hypothetical protein